MDDKLEHFNFEKIYIKEEPELEWEHDHGDQPDEFRLWVKITLDQEYLYYLSKTINPDKRPKLYIICM